MTVTREQFNKDCLEFYKRHENSEYRGRRSQYGDSWVEDECFSDGAVLTIIYKRVTEIAEVTVKGVTIKMPVEVTKIEYFSTDEPESKYTYQKR